MSAFSDGPRSPNVEGVHRNREMPRSHPFALSTRLLMWVMLAAAAVVPFIGTLQYEFVWDDHYIIKQIEELWKRGGLLAVGSAPFLPLPDVPSEYYRPVVNLSFWFDGRLSGGSAGWFHLTNILLHLGCTLLCAVILRRLMISDLGVLVGSLLFALHPAHVESIAFISGRTDLFAAFFVLLAILFWHSSRDADQRAGARVFLLFASATSFLAGSLSKENALLLPIMLVAWDLWESNCRLATHVSWWRRNFLWIGLYGLVIVVVLLLRHAALQPSQSELAVSEDAGRLLTKDPVLAILGLLRMFRMLMFPWPHNALYTRQHLTLDITSLVAVGALCALFAWTTRHRFNRLGLLGSLWVVVFLAPALLVSSSGLVMIAERYLYLPLFGFCLVMGRLLSTVSEAGSRLRSVVVAAILLGAFALGGADFARSRVWRNDLTLGEDLVRTSPGAALAHDRLGQALLAAGRYREAVTPLLQAVKLDPFYPGYHDNLGVVMGRLNQPALAAEAFRESLRLDPSRVRTRLNLVYACIALRDAACIEEQRKVLAASDPAALAELERALQRLWR